MVDRYRINLNYKYENLSTRYDIPENGSFTATYSNDQTKYTIFDTKGNEICKFNVDYQKERPVHEYVYPNHVSYIEVLPNFTNRDRLIDSALGSLNIAIIPIVSVSDDGCGFKNIDIEKATLPFYKSSKDIATEHLGLGLNISKILSERHGGNIQIANNKAGGACVTVKINCNES